jgi:hypothetical protein
MADKPKISKHHTGQHPALKSFQAFDIIPADKVKPSRTARPVISSPVTHFDTTLTPAKPEPAKPVLAVELAQPEADVTAPEAPKEVTAEPQPQTPSESAVAAPAAPEPAEAVPAQEAPKPAEADAAPATPELVEQNAAETPEPIATESTPASSETDELSGILNQTEATRTEKQPGIASKVNHSEEFKNVLKEFTAHQPQESETKPIVAVHKHNYLRAIGIGFLWLLAAAALAAVVLDILLDAGVLQDFYGLPHTNFF